MTAHGNAPQICFPARIENPEAGGRMVLVCEHASNEFPAPWGDLGLTAAQQRAHIAWDPGALGLAGFGATAEELPCACPGQPPDL